MFDLIFSLLFRFCFYYYLAALAYWVVTQKIRGGAEGKRDVVKTKKLMVVFGSGGHTTEMLLMLTKQNKFSFDKYKEV